MLKAALGAIWSARWLLGVAAILTVGSAWIATPRAASDLHFALCAGLALLAAGRLAWSASPGAERTDGRARELVLAGPGAPDDHRPTGLPTRPTVAFTTGAGGPGPGADPRKADAPGSRPRAGVESETDPSRPQDGSAPGGDERVPAGVGSRMDEVSYRPGSPNVLSMTKFVRDRGARDAGGAGAGEARAAASFLSVRNGGAETVLAIEGVLDVLTAPEVRAAVEALIEERRTPIAVELSSLERMDGAGARVLARLFRGCSAFGGTVRVIGAKEQPLAVLRLLRMDRLLGL